MATITVESKIYNINDVRSTLEQYGTIQQSISRILFNYLRNNKKAKDTFKTLQKEYIEKYNIKARMFKSIWIDVNSKIDSLTTTAKQRKDYLKEKIKDKKDKVKKTKKQEKRQILHDEINNLTQKLENDKQINAVWGSKSLYKKQWQIEDDELWQKEWRRKRNHHIYSIGSKDEHYGNSLCQLQTLTKLRLTLPKALGKHINLEVNFNYSKKRSYQYLMFAMANKQALTYRIIEKEKGWYVQIAFTLPCIAEHQNNGSLGIDINYNLIATAIVKPDGNKENFKNFKFDLRNKSKHQNKQILCDVAQEIVDQAYANNKNIVIEKIDLSKCKAKLKSKRTNEKLSLIAYAKLIQLIKYKALKQHILVIEVNPAYTSVIGKNKYRKKLGIGVHSAASYCIGRRGMKYREKVPCELTSLLQSGERRKHHWSQWASIDKKLKKVPLKEKDTNIFTDLAEILCANDV